MANANPNSTGRHPITAYPAVTTTLSEELLKSVASLSFGQPTGGNVSTEIPEVFDADQATRSMVGTVTVRFAPTVPVSWVGSPLNLASQNQYKVIRAGQSGATNYREPDLTLYALAVAHVYMLLTIGRRAYSLANSFSIENRFEQAHYIQAAGFNSVPLLENLADFRARWNAAALRIGAFAIPDYAIYRQHAGLCAAGYREMDTNKACVYFMNPSYFWQYDQTTSTSGGMLKAVNIPVNMTPDQYFTLLNDAVQAIATSEDAITMSGDIEKKYGESVLKIPALDEALAPLLVYDQEFLRMFHNMDVLGTNLYNTNITQENNNLLFSPSVNPSAALNPLLGAPIKRVDSHSRNPSVAETANALRGKIVTSPATYDSTLDLFSANLQVCGFFVAETMTTAHFSWSEGRATHATNIIHPWTVGFDKESGQIAIRKLNFLTNVSDLCWLPEITIGCVYGDSGAVVERVASIWNRLWVAPVAPATIKTFHDVYLTAAFIK